MVVDEDVTTLYVGLRQPGDGARERRAGAARTPRKGANR